MAARAARVRRDGEPQVRPITRAYGGVRKSRLVAPVAGWHGRIMTTTRTLTPAVAALAEQITRIVRGTTPSIDVAREVATVLGRALGGAGDLLAPEHTEPDPACYRQHLLYVDPEGEFSIVSLVWLPGQRTPIHDHVTWCVVGVHQGAEEEDLYRFVDGGTGAPYLVRTGHSVNAEGTTSYFAPPGDIHEVCNPTDRKVISIHVYGADISVLKSSVRRRYDLPVR